MREEVERLTKMIETAYEEVADQVKKLDAPDIHAYIMERFTGAKYYSKCLAEFMGEEEAERVRFEKFDTAMKELIREYEDRYPLPRKTTQS